MGGKLGKKGHYMVGNLEDQAAEAAGTEMEESSGGNGGSKSGAQAPQEEGEASSFQVTEGSRPDQGDAASVTEELKCAGSPRDVGSKTDTPGEMTTAGSGSEPSTDPYQCINPETVAAAPDEGAQEDPMMTPPISPLSKH